MKYAYNVQKDILNSQLANECLCTSNSQRMNIHKCTSTIALTFGDVWLVVREGSAAGEWRVEVREPSARFSKWYTYIHNYKPPARKVCTNCIYYLYACMYIFIYRLYNDVYVLSYYLLRGWRVEAREPSEKRTNMWLHIRGCTIMCMHYIIGYIFDSW